MSRIASKKLPEKGDLVMGVVVRIAKHGIYVKLKEFQDQEEYDDVEGYCHISEIAGTFIRNIRNFVRINQNVVARVLRVNQDTKQIDISLKRVSDELKRIKIQEYKRQNAAIAICGLIADKIDRDKNEVRQLIEDELTSLYGSMYNGFEEIAAMENPELGDINLPDDIKEAMVEVTKMSIQISTVTVTSTLGVRSFAPDGVEQVKQLLIAAEDVANTFSEVESEITSIGAPQYRIHLEGRSYDEVLEVLDSIENTLQDAATSLNVEYVLERKKN